MIPTVIPQPKQICPQALPRSANRVESNYSNAARQLLENGPRSPQARRAQMIRIIDEALRIMDDCPFTIPGVVPFSESSTEESE
jgi:hypothetical protein